MSTETATPAAPPEPSTAEPVAGEVSSIDLIIELYKRDVDRSLLIEQLKKTPAQRGADLDSFYRACVEHRRAVKMRYPHDR